MALGVGRLLGLELPSNFDYPFLSRSLPEFWRRWHITLNTWLFDYVYAPLTTGRGLMRGRVALAYVVVFLVSGLWHGAMWTFLAWGLLHGVGLAVHHRWDVWYKGLCRRDRAWVARRRAPAYTACAWLLTQGFFLLSLVPFRSASLATAGAFARGLFASAGARSLGHGFAVLAACALIVASYHLLELGRLSRLRERFFALPAPVRGVAYGLVIVFLLLFAPIGSGTFLYGQF
jgi:alginate O-acetyltransferase complex protein AlgI